MIEERIVVREANGDAQARRTIESSLERRLPFSLCRTWPGYTTIVGSTNTSAFMELAMRQLWCASFRVFSTCEIESADFTTIAGFKTIFADRFLRLYLLSTTLSVIAGDALTFTSQW